MKNDPWSFSEVHDDDLCEDSYWPSPNKDYTLMYSSVKQIFTRYSLTESCHLKNESEEVLLHINAGGPPVWSKDDRFFAIPIWLYNDEDYVQRIGIGSVENMSFQISTEYFKMMRLSSVDEKIIKISELPGKERNELKLKIKELDFYEKIHLPNFLGVLQ